MQIVVWACELSVRTNAEANFRPCQVKEKVTQEAALLHMEEATLFHMEEDFKLSMHLADLHILFRGLSYPIPFFLQSHFQLSYLRAGKFRGIKKTTSASLIPLWLHMYTGSLCIAWSLFETCLAKAQLQMIAVQQAATICLEAQSLEAEK